MGSNKTKALFFTTLPLILAVLIMAPRLTSAQFGFLDDGYILHEVQSILDGDLSLQSDIASGRFRPLYWLYFTLIYALAGPNPVWFFMGHLVILLITLLEIRLLMKSLGAREGQILLTSLAFLFSIPIIENFYTLSKGETLQLVFLLGALLGLEKLKQATQPRTTWFAAIFTCLSLLAAIWAKETAYIMAPLAALWAGYAHLQRKHNPQAEQRAYRIFLVATLAVIMLNFLMLSLWGNLPTRSEVYTGNYDLNFTAILTRAPRWLTLYAFYFPHLLPLAILAVVCLLKKGEPAHRFKHDLFFWAGWVLAWSVGLFPWEFAEVYYLLPFSAGLSILIGLLGGHIWQTKKTRSKPVRWVIAALAGLFSVLVLVTLTHFRTHALAQLTLDRMNDSMRAQARELLDHNGDLILGVNAYNDYYRNLGHLIIDQDGLTGITYDFISLEVLLEINSRSGAVLLLPYIENQPQLLLRVGVQEEFTMAWVEEIEQALDGQLSPVTQMRDGFQINKINLPVIVCPILGSRGFCAQPDPFFDTRVFSYGWDIYTIQ